MKNRVTRIRLVSRRHRAAFPPGELLTKTIFPASQPFFLFFSRSQSLKHTSQGGGGMRMSLSITL